MRSGVRTNDTDRQTDTGLGARTERTHSYDSVRKNTAPRTTRGDTRKLPPPLSECLERVSSSPVGQPPPTERAEVRVQPACARQEPAPCTAGWSGPPQPSPDPAPPPGPPGPPALTVVTATGGGSWPRPLVST